MEERIREARATTQEVEAFKSKGGIQLGIKNRARVSEGYTKSILRHLKLPDSLNDPATRSAFEHWLDHRDQIAHGMPADEELRLVGPSPTEPVMTIEARGIYD